MNNDLISREDLKKAIIEPLNVNDAGKNDWYDGYYTAKNEDVTYIDNASTVPLPDFKAGYKQAILDGKLNYGGQVVPDALHSWRYEERPQGDIRWTDKVFVKSNGDIIDFEGQVVGHINLEEIKGGAE